MVRHSPAFRLSLLLSFSLSVPCVFTPSRKIERACGSRRVPPPPAPAPPALAVVARVSSTRADDLTAVRPFFQRGREADSCVYSGNHISVVKAAPPTPPPSPALLPTSLGGPRTIPVCGGGFSRSSFSWDYLHVPSFLKEVLTGNEPRPKRFSFRITGAASLRLVPATCGD